MAITPIRPELSAYSHSILAVLHPLCFSCSETVTVLRLGHDISAHTRLGEAPRRGKSSPRTGALQVLERRACLALQRRGLGASGLCPSMRAGAPSEPVRDTPRSVSFLWAPAPGSGPPCRGPSRALGRWKDVNHRSAPKSGSSGHNRKLRLPETRTSTEARVAARGHRESSPLPSASLSQTLSTALKQWGRDDGLEEKKDACKGSQGLLSFGDIRDWAPASGAKPLPQLHVGCVRFRRARLLGDEPGSLIRTEERGVSSGLITDLAVTHAHAPMWTGLGLGVIIEAESGDGAFVPPAPGGRRPIGGRFPP